MLSQFILTLSLPLCSMLFADNCLLLLPRLYSSLNSNELKCFLYFSELFYVYVRMHRGSQAYSMNWKVVFECAQQR